MITPDGLLLIGGRNADGPVATTLKTTLNAQGALGAWAEEQPLVAPQPDATAVVVGDFVWLYGGQRRERSGRHGPARRVRPAGGRKGCPRTRTRARSIRWDVNDAANLPVARTNAAGWSANGAIYLAGGNDGSGPKSEVYWAVPTTDGRPARVEAPRR